MTLKKNELQKFVKEYFRIAAMTKTLIPEGRGDYEFTILAVKTKSMEDYFVLDSSSDIDSFWEDVENQIRLVLDDSIDFAEVVSKYSEYFTSFRKFVRGLEKKSDEDIDKISDEIMKQAIIEVMKGEIMADILKVMSMKLAKDTKNTPHVDTDGCETEQSYAPDTSYIDPMIQ